MSSERFSEVDAWKTNMFLYNAALKEVGTKIEILKEVKLLNEELASIDVVEDSRRTTIIDEDILDDEDDNIIDDTDFLEEELNDLRDEIGWDVDDEVVWDEYVSRQ